MTLNRVTVTVVEGASPDTKSNSINVIKKKLLGFSLYVEAEYDNRVRRILVDTGSSLSILKRRTQKLGIDLNSLDMIFITHWHLGHSLALPSLIKNLSNDVRLVVPDDPPQRGLKLMGLDTWNLDGIKTESIKRGGMLYPEIYSTGKLPYEYSKLYRSAIEQSLVLNVSETGLVVLTGCAHLGLDKILRKAVELTGKQEIDLLMGGFHFPLSDSWLQNEPGLGKLMGGFQFNLFDSWLQAESEINKLTEWKINRIAPFYCTSDAAVEHIANCFPQGFRWVSQGTKIVSEKNLMEWL